MPSWINRIRGGLRLPLLVILLLGGCETSQEQAAMPVQGLRVGQLLGGDDPAGFKRAEQPVKFNFPADHGAHQSFRSEWWYLTSVLHTASGEEFGVQFTLFRQAMAAQPSGSSRWQSEQMYLAHFAVTDVAGGQHYADMRLARQHPDNAGVTLQPAFAARIDDWRLTQVAAQPWQLRLQAGSARHELSLELDLTQTRPIRLQGDAGLSPKGVDQASYYYSVPRLQSVGELRIGAKTYKITGISWLDREWSTSVLGDHLVGWDWFALQLDDGRDLMAFRLRRRDGQRDPYDHGLLVDQQGNTRTLKPDHFTLSPTRFWRDADNAAWPVAWQLNLHLPGHQPEQLRIAALLDDQLMQLGIVYWEGIVAVTPADRPTVRLGRGYMELTGYADN